MRSLRPRARAAVLALLLAPAAPARAHASAVATAEVTILEREVTIALSVNLFELDLLLGLDRDHDGAVTPAELEAARTVLAPYRRERVSVRSGGESLPLEAGPLGTARSADGRAVALLPLRFRSAARLGDVSLRCDPLADLGPGHRTLASIARDGGVEAYAFEPGASFLSGAPTRWRLARFLLLGIGHIFTGFDHVAFLVGLLLAVGALGEVLGIVTSFTVAHSVTMALAVLGAVRLPSRWVETGIAVSIAYVAVENLLGRGVRRRWLVSLGFGLLHGFGLAGALADLHLPRAGLAASLLAFNAGVELGQIAIVAATLPLLAALRRTRFRAAVTSSASALLLMMGLFWAWERVH